MDDRLTMWRPQKNVEDFSRLFTELSGGTVKKMHPDYTTYQNASGLYSRNYIEMNIQSSISDLVEAILEGRKEGAPVLSTFTEEFLPPDTKEIFFRAGFEILPIQQHGMIYKKDRAINRTKDPHIKRIGEEQLSEWIDAMLEGFREENKPREDILYQTLIKSQDTFFLAYDIDDEIAGTALFYLTEDYPGITEVSVARKYRRRGVATALLKHMQQMVEEMDLPGAILQASPMGMPVYEQLGFHKVSNICTVHVI